MDNFNLTTGVLDSWDLLAPVSDTFTNRNKESVQVFNSISAGYYPVFGGVYKSYSSTYKNSLIQVTVCPKSSITVANTHKKRKRHKKKHCACSDHSINPKKLYIVLPGKKKDKLYVIEATDAGIFREINENKLLSECLIKSYFKDMNKSRKKSDKAKTKETGNPLQTIPECSPGCAYMNITNKTKNVSPDRSGSASPPVRSSYKTDIKVDSTMASSQKQMTKSSDKSSIKNDDTRTKSPTRQNQQKARINIYQSDKNQKTERDQESEKSPLRFGMSGKRSIESVVADEKQRSPARYDRGLDAGRPGRIRITGRLGLTEDDKCILKCDATIDDKPIPTQFRGANCALLPMCYQACNEGLKSPKEQHDVKVQAKESPIGARFRSLSATGKESQATQVDFQMVYTTANNRREDCNRGKVKQQCACVNTFDNVMGLSDAKEDTDIVLKKHHSPLIVISVYSKNGDSSENSSDLKPNNKTTEQKKDTIKIGRSRSPSPSKNSKKIVGKKSESRVTESTSKKTVRETSRKVTRSKLSQTQSRSTVRSSRTKTKTEGRTAKVKSPKSQKNPPESRRSNSPQNKQDEVNVTEQMKKALIDDFTKTYAQHINNQRNAHLDIPLQTKHNVSNITIDIEGDSEYYNVKLEQDAGKLNTELIVRKPPRLPKGKNTGDIATGETDTTSLENFLYMPENEHRKRSFSQTLMFDGTDLTMNSDPENGKELNVKDSIEVSHRRETKASVGNCERNDVPKEVDTKYLAQTKHYPGDDCSVSDPDSRDREIRKLLGIDKGIRKSNTKQYQPSVLLGNSSQGSINENSNSTIPLKNSKMRCVSQNYTCQALYDVVDTATLFRPAHQMASNNLKLIYQLSLHTPRPIILTRRQYDKVKRTIYYSILAKHNSHRTKDYKRRLYEYKQKFETDMAAKILHYDKDSQTEDVLKDQVCATTSDVNTYTINETSCGASSTYKEMDFSSSATFEKPSINDNCTQKVINVNNFYMHNVLRTVYIAKEQIQPHKRRIIEDHLLKTASVKDIQYRKRDIRKQRVRFSSSDSANYVSRTQDVKKTYSIHTIFKCHEKYITPNLGTSAYSLCNNSENLDSRLKLSEDSIQDMKPRKPFLKRLISCLVFKMSPESQMKNPTALLENGSPNTSFDSYQISTSLGAIDISSSLYDTTASFYSDHTVPGGKIKRGFLSSVRGLLSRKNV